MKSFKCFNCNSTIDAHEPNCPYCNEKQSYESRAKYLERKLINIECPKCGCNKSFYATSSYFNISYCCDCGAETSCKDKVPLPAPTITNVYCPYCNATDIKKITTSSKIGRIAIFGILSLGKVTKQWHCNNCKSDF